MIATKPWEGVFCRASQAKKWYWYRWDHLSTYFLHRAAKSMVSSRYISETTRAQNQIGWYSWRKCWWGVFHFRWNISQHNAVRSQTTQDIPKSTRLQQGWNIWPRTNNDKKLLGRQQPSLWAKKTHPQAHWSWVWEIARLPRQLDGVSVKNSKIQAMLKRRECCCCSMSSHRIVEVIQEDRCPRYIVFYFFTTIAMKYWILSDPHFHHEMMILWKYRPSDYAARILKGLQRIPKEDILICLGDITIGKDEEVHAQYIKPLMCRKILVKWNHDKKSNAWYLSHGWDFVCIDFCDFIFGKMVVFTHCPVKLDAWVVNIHGHLHSRDHRDDPRFAWCFLVSCELQWYSPQVLESFMKKQGII